MENQPIGENNGLAQDELLKADRKKKLQAANDGVQITIDYLLQVAKEKEEESPTCSTSETPHVTFKTIVEEKQPESFVYKKRKFLTFRLCASFIFVAIMIAMVYEILFSQPSTQPSMKPAITQSTLEQQITICTTEAVYTPDPTIVPTPLATKDLDGKDGFFQAINNHLSDTYDSWSYLVGYYPSDSMIHIKAETDKMGGIEFKRETDTLDELKKYDQFAKRIALVLFKEADSQNKPWKVSVAIGTSDGLSWINYRWKWSDYNGLTVTHNGHLTQ